MAGGKAVNANVLLFDQVTGERHYVAKGQVPDKEIADQLGDHLFTDPPAADDSGNDGRVPPQSGNGSGKAAWVAYAASLDPPVEVADDATRDDIIAAVAEAGHPVE